MSGDQQRAGDHRGYRFATLRTRVVSASQRLALELPVRQFVTFCLVGGSGVFVDMAILYLLADSATLHWHLILSKVCAAEVAMVNNFMWNDLWTFRGLSHDRSGISPLLKRFCKFNPICSAGILISAVVLKLLVHLAGMNLYLANLVAIGTTTLGSFGMNYVFNWGHQRWEGVVHK